MTETGCTMCEANEALLCLHCIDNEIIKDRAKYKRMLTMEETRLSKRFVEATNKDEIVSLTGSLLTVRKLRERIE